MPRASATGFPVTSGTDTGWAPLETVRRTVVPRCTVVPSDGVAEITWPEATSLENASVTVGFRPALLTAWRASDSRRPVTWGTVASPGPCETTIVTVEPFSALWWGPGFWVATWSVATPALTTRWMLTSKPRFWSV